MSEIIFTENDFRNILEELISKKSTSVRRVIGWYRNNSETHMTVCPSPIAIQTSQSAYLQILIASQIPKYNDLLNILNDSANEACLIIGNQKLNNKIWGFSKLGNFLSENINSLEIEEITKIKIIGGRLPEFKTECRISGEEFPKQVPDRKLLEKHSRTIGALGLVVWQKLIGLRFAVVGCGRTGSQIAVTLARMGATKITFIDPDRVELHNLGETTGLTESDLGKNKAEVIADFVRQNCFTNKQKTEITAVNKSIEQTNSEILACDVIFSCVDNDAARLFCGLSATSFHKILIDIGIGILSEENSSLTSRGLDVRLIIPGDGCLRCFGNLVNYNDAFSSLVYKKNSSFSQEREVEWWQQRNGSLQYLNQIASGFAVKLLCDFLTIRGFRSTWLQIEFDDFGNHTMGKKVPFGAGDYP